MPDIITSTPTFHPTPTATSTPSQTPTPQPTATDIASLTPETELHGLITEFENIPTYTADQRAAAIQKAIDTRSLTQESAGIWITQPSQFTLKEDNGDIVGFSVRIGCAIGKSCLIRDTFQMTVQTDQGERLMRTVLMELFVTFEDGSQGAVIMPYIFDQREFDPSVEPDRDTKFILQKLQKAADSSGGVVDIRFLTSGTDGFEQPTNPVVRTLIDRAFGDPVTGALLEKAYKLAGEGKFLSQDEINQLWDAIIKY